MNTQKIIYETGATSHAVNDLILFTDTTRELAAKRDAVYEMYVTAYEGGYTGNVSWVEFHPLFIKATQQHRKEIPNSQVMKIKQKGMEEYCTIYANRFADWKSEHGYK